jgi:hypothetical protein
MLGEPPQDDGQSKTAIINVNREKEEQDCKGGCEVGGRSKGTYNWKVFA